MGGNQSSVTAVVFAGAIATILMWLLGYFAPGLMAAAQPGVETAIGTVITGLLCYYLPAFGAQGQDVYPPKQGGFAYVRVLVMLALAAGVMFVLSACSTLNFDQRLAGAYSTNTGIRATAAASVNAGKLSSEQGENVLELTDKTRAVLDDAADGDERGLELAIELMQTLEDFAQ